MKKILITIIGLFSVAYGQLYQSMPQRGYGPVKNFWVDSVLILPTNVTSGSNLSGGREVGKIRYNTIDSSLEVYTGSQWLAGNRSSSLPYWELATGGALTGNNNITGSHTLTFTDQTSFNVIKSGVTRLGIGGTITQIYGPLSGSGAIFSSSAATVSGNLYSELSGGASSGRTSSIRLTADETTINPSLGVLVIDSLAAGSSQTNIVGWTETAGADRGKLGALSLGAGVSLSSGILNVSPPLSRIAAATGSNSIDNLNYLQTWAWNTHTGLFPAFIINRTSTALGASGGPMLSIVSSGANASANAVAQGLSISVTNTGTSSSNAALQLAASGATNNTALQINNGDIVLTPLTASRPLKLNGSKVITSGLIDIASSNDVTGVLPIANGGTNNASLPVTAGTVYFGDGSKVTGDNANFFWDNSNKRLGIGTASPSQKLHSQGSGTTALFKSTGYSASTVIIEDPDGTTYITNGQFKVNTVPFVANANASYISLQTAGVERARVLNTGEVGISTSTPNSTLHVAGSLSLSYKFVEDDNYEITATDYTLSVHNGENNWTIILPDASTCQGRIYIIKRYDNTSTGTITVDASGSNVQSPATGAFNTTFDLTAWGTQNQSVMFQSNGTNWEAIK